MKGKRILIIEGESHSGIELSRALKHPLGGGHQVEICLSASTALTLLTREPFDLLITDLLTPSGVSGMYIICQAHQTSPQTRTMLISGYGSPEIENQARQLGAACLTKPFSTPEFVAAVQGILDEKRIQ
jgi:DNA-binding response OmpR family regulator